MRNLFLLCLLLTSTIASATTGQITLGGITITTTGLIVIRSVNNGGDTHFIVATPGGTTRATYQVTSGKTFVPYVACIENITAQGNVVANQFLYSDTDPGVNGSGTVTNAVGVVSGVSSGDATDFMDGNNSNGAQLPRCYAVGGSVPATKYPYVHQANSKQVSTVYGYEI